MATPSSSANASSSTTPSRRDVTYRLKWGEKTEILVMQALMEFRGEKGKNPLVGVPDHEIHEYLRSVCISEDYTEEFVEKLESLKKKLFDNKRKLAEDPSSVTPFDTGVLEGIFRNELEPSKPSEKKSQGQSSTPKTGKAEGNNDGQSSTPKTGKAEGNNDGQSSTPKTRKAEGNNDGQSSTPKTRKAEGNNDGQSSRGPKTRKTKD